MKSVNNPNVMIVIGSVRINMNGRRIEFSNPSIRAATSTVCMLSMLTPAITCITTRSAIILINHFIRNFIKEIITNFLLGVNGCALSDNHREFFPICWGIIFFPGPYIL